MDWKRATSPEKKAVRERSILTAAEELFTEMDCQEVSLNAIARRAGLAKASLYRYFSTREEIFLQIFFNSFSNWAQDLSEALLTLQPCSSSEAIAQVWVHVTVRHKDLLDLTPFLYIAMERNSSVEALLKFDSEMDVPKGKLGQALQCVIPEMSEESAFRLMVYFFALTSGLWPLSQNNETKEQFYQRRRDSSKRIEYGKHMTHALQLIIQGLRQEEDSRGLNVCRKATSDTVR